MGGTEWLFAVFLLATRILASPLLQIRKWRGPRCESLAVRWLGVAAVFPVWGSGGGGDPALLHAGCLGLAFVTLVSPFGWRKAVRAGREIHSRFVGRPLAAVPLGATGAVAYLLLEPLQWGLVAVLFALAGEPGWATYFVAAGVIAAPIEYLAIDRRDRTVAQDVIDARLAQQEVWDAVHPRVRR